MLTRALPLITLMLATPVLAQPLTLSPADPQPGEADLSPGLAVSYAYPRDVRTLEDAADALKRGESGPALRGFSYPDNAEGDLTLTSESAQKVAAAISGFIRFDAPGTYRVNVVSNDGIVASIGGQEVAFNDEVHACEPAGEQEITVPEPGWYEIEATYFQRKGTACLEMDWDAGGRMGPVPDDVFAHLK